MSSLLVSPLLSGFPHRSDARCFLSGIRRAGRCPCELHPCPKIFPDILWLDAVILMTRNQKTKGDLFAKFFKTCQFFMNEMQEIKVLFKKNCPLLTRVFSLSKEGRQWLRPLLQYKSGLLSVRCRKNFPIPE